MDTMKKNGTNVFVTDNPLKKLENRKAQSERMKKIYKEGKNPFQSYLNLVH